VTYKDNTITAFEIFVMSDAAQALRKLLPLSLCCSSPASREANSRTSNRWVWALAQASLPFPTPVAKALPAAFPKFPRDLRVGFVCFFFFYQLSYLAGLDTILSDLQSTWQFLYRFVQTRVDRKLRTAVSTLLPNKQSRIKWGFGKFDNDSKKSKTHWRCSEARGWRWLSSVHKKGKLLVCQPLNCHLWE